MTRTEAIAKGRNAVWYETGVEEMPTKELQDDFNYGYRSARAEQRLDKDRSWG